MDFEFVADIARGESAYFAMRELGSVRVRRVLSAFEASGEIFARDGEIPADKLEAMRMPLSRGRESFAKTRACFGSCVATGLRSRAFPWFPTPAYSCARCAQPSTVARAGAGRLQVRFPRQGLDVSCAREKRGVFF